MVQNTDEKSNCIYSLSACGNKCVPNISCLYYTALIFYLLPKISLTFFHYVTPHHLRSGSALKTDRGEVPGSIPDRACRLSRSEFSVIFSETRVNTGQDPLERLQRRALSLQAALTLQQQQPIMWRCSPNYNRILVQKELNASKTFRYIIKDC